MHKSLTVIVPALNEEDNLEASVIEILGAADKSKLSIEIIIVDDGSKDGTWACAQKLQSTYEGIKCIRNQATKGLGGAYKTGIAASRSEYISWVPADCSHGCESLLDAYCAIGQADIVIPIPTNPHVRPLSRQIISKLFTFIVNKISPKKIPYYNGLSIHKTSLLREIEIKTDSFGFQAEIIVRLLRKGATHKLVDTIISERKKGSSKAFTVKNVVEVVKTIGNLKSSS